MVQRTIRKLQLVPSQMSRLVGGIHFRSKNVPPVFLCPADRIVNRLPRHLTNGLYKPGLLNHPPSPQDCQSLTSIRKHLLQTVEAILNYSNHIIAFLARCQLTQTSFKETFLDGSSRDERSENIELVADFDSFGGGYLAKHLSAERSEDLEDFSLNSCEAIAKQCNRLLVCQLCGDVEFGTLEYFRSETAASEQRCG